MTGMIVAEQVGKAKVRVARQTLLWEAMGCKTLSTVEVAQILKISTRKALLELQSARTKGWVDCVEGDAKNTSEFANCRWRWREIESGIEF